MSQRVLVTGATGKVGSRVAGLLLQEGRSVKAATRSLARARGMLPDAAEIVEFDFDRAETWDAAVEWADRIFVVPPPFDPHAYRTLASFIDWSVQAGVAHMVVLTAMAVERRPDLALRRVELLVQETGVAHTFLRPNVYMQNFHPGFVGREIREEGSFHLPAGDSPVSLVDAEDVAAVAARVLTDEIGDHDGRAWTLTGPAALDHHEVAGILSRVADRDIRYVPGDDDAMAHRLSTLGWPTDQIAVVIDFFRSIRSGDRTLVTPDVETVLGRPPRSFADFAAAHASAWSEPGS